MKKLIPFAIVAVILMNCESKKKKYIPLTNILNQELKTAGNSGSGGQTIVNIPTPSANEENSINEVQPGVSIGVTNNNTNPFTYETTTTIPVDSTLTDSQGNPISSATVTITNSTDDTVLLQQVTDQNGNITGSITVPSTTTSVELTVTSGGVTSQPVEIPLQVPVTNNGTTTNETISSIGNVTLPTTNTGTQTQVADRDGDGVDDIHDSYPDDPAKATKVRYPSNGVNTIAFEDLYPNAGDADLNDYVIQFYTEEDLNAQGQIVEIRGGYQHVAKGAGYNHSLNLRLPSSLSLSFETTVTDYLGNPKNTGITKFNPTATDIQDGLQILGDSSKTISSSNVNLNSTYKPGDVSKIKIIFSSPVTRANLGTAPYDIFIKVLSKPLFTCKTDNDKGHGNDLDGVDEDNPGNSQGVNENGMSNRNENSFNNQKDQCKVKANSEYPKSAPRSSTVNKQYYEVHFPGLYKDENGKEIYLDQNGFPWAIQIPGVWAWQLESKDIRKSNESGYPRFNSWATSKGATDKDWYTTVTSGRVYVLPAEPSNLLAYLKNGDSSTNIMLAVGLIVFGITSGFIVRKRLNSV